MTDHDHSLCVLADDAQAFCLATGKPGLCVGQKRGQKQPVYVQPKLRTVPTAPVRDTAGESRRAAEVRDADNTANRQQMLAETGGLKGRQGAGVRSSVQHAKRGAAATKRAQAGYERQVTREQRQHDSAVKANEKSTERAAVTNAKRKESFDARQAKAAAKKGGKAKGPVSVAQWLKYGVDGADAIDFWLGEFAGKKPGKCKYCASPAAKGVVWAEGMARIPVCDEHLTKAKQTVAREEGPGGVIRVDRVVGDAWVRGGNAYASVQVDESYVPVLADDDSTLFALYGLERALSDDLYRLADPAHDFCNIGDFCRNPLHPGPCRGWKHMLHSVSPAAYHTMEKERVAKLNAKRKAKIAALEAAGKKVPAYLKKEVTYAKTPTAPEGSSYKAPTPEQAKAALPPTMKEIEKNLHGKHAAKSAAVTGNPNATTKQKVNQHLLLDGEGMAKLPAATQGKILSDLAKAEHDPDVSAEVKKAASDKLDKLADAAATGSMDGKTIAHAHKTNAAKAAGKPAPEAPAKPKVDNPPGYLSDKDGDGDGKAYDGTKWERKAKAEKAADLIDGKSAPAGGVPEGHHEDLHDVLNDKTLTAHQKITALPIWDSKAYDKLPDAQKKQVTDLLEHVADSPAYNTDQKLDATIMHEKLTGKKLHAIQQTAEQHVAIAGLNGESWNEDYYSADMKAKTLGKLDKETYDALNHKQKARANEAIKQLEAANHPDIAGIKAKLGLVQALPKDAPAGAPEAPEAPASPTAHYSDAQKAVAAALNSDGTPLQRLAKIKGLKTAEYNSLVPAHKQRVDALIAKNQQGASMKGRVIATTLKEGWAGNLKGKSEPVRAAIKGLNGDETPAGRLAAYKHMTKAEFDDLHSVFRAAIKQDLEKLKKTYGTYVRSALKKFNAPSTAEAAKVDAPAAPKAAPGGPAGALTKLPGSIGSNHGAYKAKDEAGNEWVVKPKESGKSMIGPAEAAVSQLSNAVGLDTPHVILQPDGSTVQAWVKGSKLAFPNGFDPKDLSSDDILAIQKHHAIDWLTGQHDAHYRNWLRDENGNLVEVDKGQAFKFYASDKLSPSYHPNGAIGEQPPIYNALVKAGAAGQANLHSPDEGPLRDFLAKVQGLPDAEVKAMFRPYAEAVKSEGIPLPGGSVDGFLDKVIARKNGLAKAFSDLHKEQGVVHIDHMPDVPAEAATKGHAKHSSSPFHILDDSGLSGDGYYTNPDGSKGPWGKYGAAGVLIKAPGPDGEPRFLLVQRGPGTSTNKGKWQLPGGGLDSKENAHQGAARETYEELGASGAYLAKLKPHGEHVYETAGGWKYTSIAAEHDRMFDPKVDGTETGAAKWFTAAELAQLDEDGKLHPSLAGGGLEKNVVGLFPGKPEAAEHVSTKTAADLGITLPDTAGEHPALAKLAGANTAYAKYQAVKPLTKDEYKALTPAQRKQVADALNQVAGSESLWKANAKGKIEELGIRLAPAASGGADMQAKAATLGQLLSETGALPNAISAAKVKFLNDVTGTPSEHNLVKNAAKMAATMALKKYEDAYGKIATGAHYDALHEAVEKDILKAVDEGKLPATFSAYGIVLDGSKAAVLAKAAQLSGVPAPDEKPKAGLTDHPDKHVKEALEVLSGTDGEHYSPSQKLFFIDSSITPNDYDDFTPEQKKLVVDALKEADQAGLAKAANIAHKFEINLDAEPAKRKAPAGANPNAAAEGHAAATVDGLKAVLAYLPGYSNKAKLDLLKALPKDEFDKLTPALKVKILNLAMDVKAAGYPSAQEVLDYLQKMPAPAHVNAPAGVDLDAPHVKAAIEWADGTAKTKPTSTKHLEAYSQLSAEEYQALTPVQQAVIKAHLLDAIGKFLDPKKKTAAKETLDKLTGPVSHTQAPAPAAPDVLADLVNNAGSDPLQAHTDLLAGMADHIYSNIGLKKPETIKQFLKDADAKGTADAYEGEVKDLGILIGHQMVKQSLDNLGITEEHVGGLDAKKALTYQLADVIAAATLAGSPDGAKVLADLNVAVGGVNVGGKNLADGNGWPVDSDAIKAWKGQVFTAYLQAEFAKHPQAAPKVTAPAGAGGHTTAPNVIPIHDLPTTAAASEVQEVKGILDGWAVTKEMVKMEALDKLGGGDFLALSPAHQKKALDLVAKIHDETTKDDKKAFAAKLLPKLQQAKLSQLSGVTKEQFQAMPDAAQDAHVEAIESMTTSLDPVVVAVAKGLLAKLPVTPKTEHNGMKFKGGAVIKPVQDSQFPVKLVVPSGHEQKVQEHLDKIAASAYLDLEPLEVPTIKMKEMSEKRDSTPTGKAYGTKYSWSSVWNAYRAYTGNFYDDINLLLRDSKGKEIGAATSTPGKSIRAMDAVFAHPDAKLKKPITVLRGFRNPAGVFKDGWLPDKSMVGVEFTEHGYTSSTTRLKTARQFSGADYGSPKDSVIMRIYAPEGTPAVTAHTYSTHSGEEEIVLGRGMQYRIVADHGYQNGARHIDVEIVL